MEKTRVLNIDALAITEKDMSEEQKKLFLGLKESRSTEHTGGRKKKASKV